MVMVVVLLLTSPAFSSASWPGGPTSVDLSLRGRHADFLPTTLGYETGTKVGGRHLTLSLSLAPSLTPFPSLTFNPLFVLGGASVSSFFGPRFVRGL